MAHGLHLQHASALSSAPVSSTVVTRQADTGDALNYTLSIAGYQPEEVSVSHRPSIIDYSFLI